MESFFEYHEERILVVGRSNPINLITSQPKLSPYNIKKNDSLLIIFIWFSAIVRLNLRILTYLYGFNFFELCKPHLRPNNTSIEFIGLYITKSIQSVITDKDTEKSKSLICIAYRIEAFLQV